MAKFDTADMEQLLLDMKEIADMPEGVITDMLQAEADVIIPAQKETAVSLGVVDSGILAASIKSGKVTRTADGATMSVYPQGSRKRGNTTTSNSEIAFINEFGKHGQPPRPFIQTANEKYADRAVDAAFDVYDEYLRSRNL